MTPRPLGLAAGLLSIAMVSACGATGGGAPTTVGSRSSPPSTPCSTPSQQVGGPHVAVQGLTKPGAEPHDLELSPRQVGSIAQADVVVYEEHFQPAVDDAVAQQAGKTALDVSPAARLDLVAVEDGHDHARRDRGGARRRTAPATRTSGSTRCATPTSATPSPPGWPSATRPTPRHTGPTPRRSAPR